MPPIDVYTGYKPQIRKTSDSDNLIASATRGAPTRIEAAIGQPSTAEELARIRTPIDAYTAADAGSLGVAPTPDYLLGSADQGHRAGDAGLLGLTAAESKPQPKPVTDYTAVDAGSIGISLPAPYFSGAANDGSMAADAGSLGLIEEHSRLKIEEWYDDAGDNTVVTSRNFVAGGKVDVPIYGAAGLTVGASVDLQRNTYTDGSVVIKANITGSLGTEVANLLGLEVNGDLGTEYKFSNEAEAQEFIDAMGDAVDLGSPGAYSPVTVAAIAQVISENESNHRAYRGGLGLEATLSANAGNSSIDLSAAAGVEQNFTNETTTYYANLSGSASVDLGLENKFGISGKTEIKLIVDGEGNATELKLIGNVSGSGPVQGVVDSFYLTDNPKAADELENVIPGTGNSESVSANVTMTIDLSEPGNSQATADLVGSLFGVGDQTIHAASAELLDSAEVKVDIATTESGVVSVDAETVEFDIGNSETVTVASYGKPADGDFRQLDIG